jgi:hypothetical protein
MRRSLRDTNGLFNLRPAEPQMVVKSFTITFQKKTANKTQIFVEMVEMES